MESRSQNRGWSSESPFSLLLGGGPGQGSSSTEGLTRDMIQRLKTQPWGSCVGENVTDANITLEKVPIDTDFEPPSIFCAKGSKRKRSHGVPRSSGYLESLDLEEDSGLVLGLGQTASTTDRGGGLGNRNSAGRMFMKEQLQMDLGLGLMGPGSHGFMGDGFAFSGGITSGGASSVLTSADSETAAFSHASHNSGMSQNTLLQLGHLQSTPRKTKCGGVGKGFVFLNCNAGQSESEMHLQLSLSGNSAIMTDSNCLSYAPLGLEQSGNVPEIVPDSIQGMEHIPVVDEGSTSARLVKSGGYIPSLLMGRRLDNFDQVHMTRVDIRNPSSGLETALSLPDETDMLEPDFSMGIRASSGTASTSGASAGILERASKTCKFKGCGKGARGASGLCIAHGGGRRCQKQGCNKGAEGRTVYCKAHGGGRRCQRLGCTKSAEGKTDYCISHGGGRRCSYEGCTKAARGRSGLCIRHGGGKRCQREGCTKSAEGYSGLCISHGGGRRCQFPDCGKGAQGSTLFCKAHGGGKRCMIQGCNKGAEGSTPLCKGHGGGKRCMYDGGGICTKSVHGGTLYCVAHGGGKRCAIQGCTKSARGRTDYCVRHGGGKRCKFEGCGKSAQGSTDFCKAHGGGKRCSWGQEGSPYSGELLRDRTGELFKGTCDRFARGKTGLCAAHSALVQDRRIHGGGTLGTSLTPGIGPGLFRGLVSGSSQNSENFQSSSESNKQHVGNADEHSLGSVNPGIWKHTMERGWEDGQSSIGNDSCYHLQTDVLAERSENFQQMTYNLSNTSSHVPANRPFQGTDLDLSPSPHGSSGHWSAHSILHGNIASTSNLKDTSAGTNSFLGTRGSSSTQVQTSEAGPSYSQSLIPPQVLVPLSMQKGNQSASHAEECLNQTTLMPASDERVFNMSSLSLPDERVHGGSLMALLAKEAAGTRNPTQQPFCFGMGSKRAVNASYYNNRGESEQHRLE